MFTALNDTMRVRFHAKRKHEMMVAKFKASQNIMILPDCDLAHTNEEETKQNRTNSSDVMRNSLNLQQLTAYVSTNHVLSNQNCDNKTKPMGDETKCDFVIKRMEPPRD